MGAKGFDVFSEGQVRRRVVDDPTPHKGEPHKSSKAKNTVLTMVKNFVSKLVSSFDAEPALMAA